MPIVDAQIAYRMFATKRPTFDTPMYPRSSTNLRNAIFQKIFAQESNKADFLDGRKERNDRDRLND